MIPAGGKRTTQRKPTLSRADATREKLLVSATEYFAKRGFDGSTRELAKSIGVSQSFLYHYFYRKVYLINSVYNRLYGMRWRQEWDEIFTDKTLSGRERIKTFYLSYYRTVLKRPWTRIFLFGALRGLDIHKKSADLVQEKIFPRIIGELYGDRPSLTISELTDEEFELAWHMHSTIFYLAVRRWVLRLKSPFAVDESISFAVDVFFDGARRKLGIISDSN